ncbi:MAG: hypothetical protein HY850_07765 [Betaproteobacteria bacterium]|nr:hypothetical protein [Betaproteobacteria bacterium]
MRLSQLCRPFRFVLAFCLPLLFAAPAWPADPMPTPSVTATATQAAPAAAAPAADNDTAKPEPAWVAPKPWFVYAVVGIVLIGSLYALILIRAALVNSKWSLSDALSEETAVTAIETVNGVEKPMLDANQQPLTITEMRASTSRVVALMGMIVIIMMFLGFGTFALFEFAMTGNMPKSIDNVVNYLLAGLTLFAPYVANKFSTMFASLTPRR